MKSLVFTELAQMMDEHDEIMHSSDDAQLNFIELYTKIKRINHYLVEYRKAKVRKKVRKEYGEALKLLLVTTLAGNRHSFDIAMARRDDPHFFLRLEAGIDQGEMYIGVSFTSKEDQLH